MRSYCCKLFQKSPRETVHIQRPHIPTSTPTEAYSELEWLRASLIRAKNRTNLNASSSQNAAVGSCRHSNSARTPLLMVTFSTHVQVKNLDIQVPTLPLSSPSRSRNSLLPSDRFPRKASLPPPALPPPPPARALRGTPALPRTPGEAARNFAQPSAAPAPGTSGRQGQL